MKPWFRNIENTLRKTPKWYLRDWSAIADEGKRVETLVACHLLKAVETWTDLGLGDYGLYYIRTSRKEEVDCFEPGYVGAVPLCTFLSQLP